MTEKQTRVLVVDDETSVRTSLGGYLEDRGLQVMTASSGEEGLEILGQKAIDFAIVDIRLPGMNGNDFIVAHEVQPDLVFFIHTGSTTYQLPEAAMAIGMTVESVFHKPVDDMSILADAIYKSRQDGRNGPKPGAS